MLLSALGILIIFIITIILAKYLGGYIAEVFDYNEKQKERSKFDRFFLPVENFIYKIGGIKKENQSWQKYVGSLLGVNVAIMILVYIVLRFQGSLPLNPDNMVGLTPDLSFHTAISFLTNTNQQHYGGDASLSYLSQMMLVFAMFVGPTTGLVALIALIRGLIGKKIGNFFVDLTRGIVRIYLPICIILTVIYIGLGMPQTFEGAAHVQTLEEESQTIARGPVASFLAIKQLGNNGGGFMAMNASHPFENPNWFSNLLHIISMFIIPFALPFTYGKMVKNKKEGFVLFGAMLALTVIIFATGFYFEYQGNPEFDRIGVQQQQGSMEGKEVRFGSGMSIFYALTTTATQTGAVNTMHDTLTPIGGLMAATNMLLNGSFGGVGVGLMNVLMYAMIAVFIAGLMIGRTPEFLRKKIGKKEIKLIAVTLLISPFLILALTALALYLPAGREAITNPGPHGITQILYEYGSATLNNGSGFEGLADGSYFWNITTGIAIFIGRYFSIVTLIAVGASLGKKQSVPDSEGTFNTDNTLFGVLLIGTLIIVGALTFVPAFSLGPIAEYLMLY